MVEDRDGKPPRGDHLVMHYFCIWGGDALLRSFLAVSSSMEREFLSVLSIYPGIILKLFAINYRLLLRILLCYVSVLYFHVR